MGKKRVEQGAKGEGGGGGREGARGVKGTLPAGKGRVRARAWSIMRGDVVSPP